MLKLVGSHRPVTRKRVAATFKGWLTICNGCYKEIEPMGGWQMTDAERKERYDAGNTFAEVLAAERNLKAALMEAFCAAHCRTHMPSAHRQ